TRCEHVVLPFEPSWSRAVYHLFVIRVKNRDALQKFLAERGISTGLHYPVPLHRQKAYTGNADLGELKMTDLVSGEILSLPMFPGLSDSQIKYVSENILKFFSHETT
ncbi:MAG: DegT/DnrJ/EryC1/StrS aminotransferase family protein, partial [Nitrospirae bacterium]|nr:DegT/DnrJ/EryC1/StrS aminotransferase family protein [Nitrospirota bacterium]